MSVKVSERTSQMAKVIISETGNENRGREKLSAAESNHKKS